MMNDEVLRVLEVARDLRCSKSHVYNAIRGQLSGVTPLPVIRMGRRFLVTRSALERWKKDNQRTQLL
jgi:excisionase family DNA binding protein